MECAESALEGRCGPCQESRRQVGCGQTRCQRGAPGAGSTAPLSSHCVMSGSVFLGYNFCSCRTRKKEIVSKSLTAYPTKKAIFDCFICFLTTGLMSSGLGKLIWLWACILNFAAAPHTCPEQHLLGSESWAGSKINRRPGPCSCGLERGTGKRRIV